jgi:serine/threonine-protein kinase
MAVTDPLRLAGSTVANLRFDECIHAGGFGIVYRGRQSSSEKQIAIKCWDLGRLQKTNAAMREAILRRFENEARLVARLSTENIDIARCLTAGELPAAGERVPYAVLEWLDGRSLAEDLEGRRKRGAKARPLAEAVELLDSAARALAHAHGQPEPVVHRDLRPANLMLAHTRAGTRLKVLDLGVAKSLCDEPAIGFAQDVITIDGEHLCSPTYGAPEQFSPNLGAIGPWTDIYSLALVLLEILRGRPVRPATTIAQGLVAALDPKVGSPTAKSLGLSLPPAVEELLARAVAQKPLERPAHAGAFWSAMRELVRQSTPSSAPLASTAFAKGPDIVVPPSSGDPTSFTGTLVMVDAPKGALHLLTPHGSLKPGVGPSSAPDSSGESPKTPPPMTGRAMASPLAASLSPGIASPLSNVPTSAVPPAIIVNPPSRPASSGTRNDDDVAFRRTELDGLPVLLPPSPPPPSQAPVTAPAPAPGAAAPRSNRAAIVLLLLLLAAVVACAGAIWRLYPSR